jgi:hypothetical protein
VIDRLESAVRAASHAVELILDGVVAANPWWIAGGVLLHVLSQAVRTVGWFNIIRAAYPEARGLRPHHVIAAYFGGAGLNGVVPARGGDLLKLFLVHRKVPGSRYSTLAATFVPETLFETAVGIALVVWALSRGFVPVPTAASELPTLDVSLIIRHPVISATSAALLCAGGVLLVRRLRRTARPLIERLRRGFAILESPRRFISGVLAWQALGRVIRLGSLGCFLAAFALPLTLGTMVLVMAAQGGGRIIPIAPVSAGLRIAMLSYGFVEVTGERVDIASITAFWFGIGFAHLVSGLGLSALVIGRELGTLSPTRAVAAARRALGGRRPAATRRAG